MAERSRCFVLLRSRYLMLWGFYQVSPLPMAISRPCSSLYTTTLPNQITFGFWALISEDVIRIVVLTQGSGSWPDPLLLTFASCGLMPRRMPTSVRMDTWLGALSQALFPLHQSGWTQLVCGLTAGHSTKDSPAVTCLKDCLETMVLREDHHKPHQLLLELRCPCPR